MAFMEVDGIEINSTDVLLDVVDHMKYVPFELSINNLRYSFDGTFDDTYWVPKKNPFLSTRIILKTGFEVVPEETPESQVCFKIAEIESDSDYIYFNLRVWDCKHKKSDDF
ncbi:MAG TPA: hypothetical protein HA306_01220 [Methanosarcina sp.]|nr:hypothetical protein [Methanosarcina sp.]